MRKFSALLLAVILLALAFSACGTQPANVEKTKEPVEKAAEKLDEHGVYSSKNDVALFIHTYDRLPDNYITKTEAKKLGWQGGGWKFHGRQRP